jgi:tetratricopeptide (TPR) repeat protein
LNSILDVELFIRVIAKYDLGDFKGAIVDYNQVLKINPNYAKAYTNRGLVKYDLGDKQGALSDLKTAAQLFQQMGDQINYQKVLRAAQKRSLPL